MKDQKKVKKWHDETHNSLKSWFYGGLCLRNHALLLQVSGHYDFLIGYWVLKEAKLRLRAMLPPALFLAIAGYFAWNAVHGARGLEAQAAQRAELASAQARFAVADAERAQWDTRIAALSDKSVQPDMLDDQARTVLNLASPTDIVVALPSAAGAK